MVSAASALEIPVRGYVSCVVGCPYEGAVDPKKAAEVAKTLFDMGCYEVSLGDTIGVGNPASVKRLIEACAKLLPIEKLAGHYHDTYGMAIANIYASLQMGMAVFRQFDRRPWRLPLRQRRLRQRGNRRCCLFIAGHGH